MADGDALGRAAKIEQREIGVAVGDGSSRLPHQLQLGIVVPDCTHHALGGKPVENGHIAQGVIQPPPDGAQKQHLGKAPALRLPGGKHGVGIVLLPGESNGLHREVRHGMGVEVPHDEIRQHPQGL